MMELSFGNRRRAQTSSAWLSQPQSQTHTHTHQASIIGSSQHHAQLSQKLLVRKQHSFIEGGSASSGCGYLSRGLSVDRRTAGNYDSVRHKLIVPASTAAAGRQKHTAVQHKLSRQVSKSKDSLLLGTNHANHYSKPSRYAYGAQQRNYGAPPPVAGAGGGGAGAGAGTKAGRHIVAWCSTSSLLKTLDAELSQVNGALERKHHNQAANNQAASAPDGVVVGGKKHDSKAIATAPGVGGAATSPGSAGEPLKHNGNHGRPMMAVANKNDAHKINLNIFLSQTIRATTEHEIANSDVDSSSEAAEPQNATHLASAKPFLGANQKRSTASVGGDSINSEAKLAASRRAQFQTSRYATANTAVGTPPVASTTLSPPITAAVAPSTNGGGNNFSASPSLTVQRRPPLVRAMSAPVRSYDENSKSAIAVGKRKSRRRKLVAARNVGCEKTDAALLGACDDNADANGKRVLSRTRSALAADVITLVSLISSEGSDSEKEDTSTTTTATNSDNSPTRRAPSLRKTGKSVSFQENYPANFQLASKEYSQMIRRGSVAPIAARVRGNRPPTAPPVSIFLNDKTNNGDAMPTTTMGGRGANSSRAAATAQTPAGEDVSPTAEKENSGEDYIFPEYVRSIKERECWKLYQKMCAKGVTVTYDTILRGMLTPTEFRQLQKQRDHEESKVREAELEAAGAATDKVKPPPTAIERLSETLLKK